MLMICIITLRDRGTARCTKAPSMPRSREGPDPKDLLYASSISGYKKFLSKVKRPRVIYKERGEDHTYRFGHLKNQNPLHLTPQIQTCTVGQLQLQLAQLVVFPCLKRHKIHELLWFSSVHMLLLQGKIQGLQIAQRFFTLATSINHKEKKRTCHHNKD